METSSTFLLCWQTLTASFVLVFVEYFLVLRHVFVWSGNLESASQQCVDSMKRDRYPWDSLFPVTYRGSASFIVCSTTWRKSWTDQTTTSCRSSRVSTNIPCPSSTNTVTSSRPTFTMYARFHTKSFGYLKLIFVLLFFLQKFSFVAPHLKQLPSIPQDVSKLHYVYLHRPLVLFTPLHCIFYFDFPAQPDGVLQRCRCKQHDHSFCQVSFNNYIYWVIF